jgi:hypothetical protein
MQNADGLRHAFLDGDILRFGQASPNVGDGPMRLVGGDDNGDGTQQVLQRIYDDQGGYTERLPATSHFIPSTITFTSTASRCIRCEPFFPIATTMEFQRLATSFEVVRKPASV